MFFLTCKSRWSSLTGHTQLDVARILVRKCVFNESHQRLLNISCQVEPLQSRGLIRVSGEDASSFLQGIVTNDMKHFQDSKSLFTMFLNTKGRVLFDSIIYKRSSENTFFVECDVNGLHDLIKHLKMYRVRRKVDIAAVEDEWKVWALFNPKEAENNNNFSKGLKQDQVVPYSTVNFANKKDHNIFGDLILGSTDIYLDPRLSSLGYRAIAPNGDDLAVNVRNAGVLVDSSSTYSYRMFRYRLGVGEGIEEHPTGKCFPLEANCDYLHGVSFHKGCYIGQELTARTHHTGVVRKRLMPLLLEKDVETNDVPVDSPIEALSSEKKSVIGKLRGVEKNSALGLMRIVEALEENKLKIGSTEATTLRPFWWPQELPKERVDSSGVKKG